MEEKGLELQDNFVLPPVIEFVKLLNREKDFIVIRNNIEITRDFAMKLFAVTNFNYDADVQQMTLIDEGGWAVIIKATVWKEGKKAIGLGACTTEEILSKDKEGKFNARNFHDAVATAETRAYKRALEMMGGLPFINDVIEMVFGTFQDDGNEDHALRATVIKTLMEALNNEHFTGQVEYSKLRGLKNPDIVDENNNVNLDAFKDKYSPLLNAGQLTLKRLQTFQKHTLTLLGLATKRDESKQPEETEQVLGDKELFEEINDLRKDI